MKNKILLIDGHSILNRAYYGLPLLSNAQGLHTNAVYGFLNIFFKAVDDVKPTHAAVAFDLSAPTFRHKMFDGYKGTRKKMPDELAEQVPVMKEVLRAMDVAVLEKEGFEADDIIGTQSVLAAKNGMNAVILSGDRDLLQLVNDDVTLMLPKTSMGSTTVETFTPERVREVYQIGPDKIVDLKAMMGDSSDNIPGLPGVGEKTATNLILQYGSLEAAHEHLDEIKPKKAMEAFRDSYELGELSKKLATIKTDVDLGVPFDDLAVHEFYTPAAYDIFKTLEFKNFLARFDGAEKAVQGEVVIKYIEAAGEADELIKRADGQKKIGFYLDTGEGFEAPARSLSLAFGDECYCIKRGGDISDEYLKSALGELLAGGVHCLTIDFKEQLNVIKMNGRADVFDCAVAAYLIDPLRADYTYEYIAGRFANISLPSAEEVVGGRITKKTVVTEEQLCRISAYTAYSAYMAEGALKRELDELGMTSLFDEIEMPFVYTLSDMEKAGIKMDADALAEYSVMLKAQIDILEESIYKQAGEVFNINSPKQLGVILFEKLHLSGGKKTKTGYSTASDVLEKLAEDAPIVNDILKYRQLTKLKSTYADALGNYVRRDGRIHSHFKQTVTATGRISSADPNMQNIPVRMELGRKIRRVFVPEDGCVFVDADYSQIELRVLAHMSGDERLIEAYKKDSDIHRITASQVFGVPLDEVTPLMRRNAKAVNFGIVYGISSFGLSQDLSITRKEAQSYIEKYFETYPDIKRYLDKTVEDAKKNGYTTTMFGRRRPIPELKASNFMQRQFGERVAMNSPIQGTAADIIKIAMNNVAKRLADERLKSRLILQVHDELLIEAPESEKDEVCRILKEEMEKAATLSVDLIVDMNTGHNWDEAH